MANNNIQQVTITFVVTVVINSSPWCQTNLGILVSVWSSEVQATHSSQPVSDGCYYNIHHRNKETHTERG